MASSKLEEVASRDEAKDPSEDKSLSKKRTRPLKPARFDYKELCSAKFSAYYRAQQLFADESEWQEFDACLQRELPMCFRINQSSPLSDWIVAQLTNDAFDLDSVEAKGFEMYGTKFAKPFPMAWYSSDSLAWQCVFPKRYFRASEECPQLGQFKAFLVECTRVGAMSRQEAVSMVPPLFLDVRPGHLVLDVCAAPGSKTAQILEAVDAEAGGFVVANDADLKRAHVLISQLKRLGAPNYAVMNLFAQCIPKTPFESLLSLEAPETEERMSDESLATSSSSSSSAARKKKKRKKGGIFDRVLCDVPCSSDGTMRKNPELWRKWSPSFGNALHKTQLAILERSVHLCRAGGLIVYSTCSLNPLENEAVVAAVCRQTKFRVEVVDTLGQVPLLKRTPGRERWMVCDRLYQDALLLPPEARAKTKKVKLAEAEVPRWYRSFDDVPRHRRKEHPQSMFSPFVVVGADDDCCTSDADVNITDADADVRMASSPSSSSSSFSKEAEKKDCLDTKLGCLRAWIKLRHCMRFMPHYSDTGGFFVCVLRKLGDDEWNERKRHWQSLSEPIGATETSASSATSSSKTGKEEKDEEDEEEGGDSKLPPAPKTRKRKREDWYNEVNAPYVRLCGVEPLAHEFDALVKHYGFEACVDELKSAIMVRSLGRPRALWYVAPKRLADLVTSWRRTASAAADSDEDQDPLKLMQTGVRAFQLHKSKTCTHECEWRIVQDGVPLVVPLMTRQLVTVTSRLFAELVFHGSLTFDLRSAEYLGELSEEEVAQLVLLKELQPGGAVVRMATVARKLPVRWSAVACWKSRSRVDLMISAEESSLIRSHLYKMFKMQQQEQEEKEDGGVVGGVVGDVDLEAYWQEALIKEAQRQKEKLEREAAKRKKKKEARGGLKRGKRRKVR